VEIWTISMPSANSGVLPGSNQPSRGIIADAKRAE
jgi:hypothetical protein